MPPAAAASAIVRTVSICITHDLWTDLSRRIDDFLSEVSLGSLLERGEVQAISRRQDARTEQERNDGRLIDARVLN